MQIRELEYKFNQLSLLLVEVEVGEDDVGADDVVEEETVEPIPSTSVAAEQIASTSTAVQPIPSTPMAKNKRPRSPLPSLDTTRPSIAPSNGGFTCAGYFYIHIDMNSHTNHLFISYFRFE